jgi:hypothetical protein
MIQAIEEECERVDSGTWQVPAVEFVICGDPSDSHHIY